MRDDANEKGKDVVVGWFVKRSGVFSWRFWVDLCWPSGSTTSKFLEWLKLGQKNASLQM